MGLPCSYGGVLFAFLVIAVTLLAACVGQDPVYAVVCSVRSPSGMGSWKRHHENIGVLRFYVYLDECDSADVPGRRELSGAGLADFTAYDREFVTTREGAFGSLWDQPKVNVHKQRAVVNDAVARARADGVAWLFHIDGDELLFPAGASMRSAMRGIPRDVTRVFYDNLELLPERPDVVDCFAEPSLFRLDGSNFRHYANGKGACRPNAPGVRIAEGPHRFDGPGREMKVPPGKLVVLHYVSCSRAEMEKKMRFMGQFTSYFGGIAFHEDNMTALRECEASDPAACGAMLDARFAERMRPTPGERTVRLRAVL